MVDWPPFLSPDARIDFWTILVGIVNNTSCAILGCYLVLRRMSLLGDAISHAILPGLALAFIATGQLSPAAMLAGALVFGLLTAVLTQTLHLAGNVPEDASMGVVFTSLFAFGVILIRYAADRVDIDPGCVLYGMIDVVAIDTIPFAGHEIPRTLRTLLPMLAATILFVGLFWKELKLASFDASLATAMGFSAVVLHYLLMAMVAGVTVASFEAVGSILVIGMLIVPPATAHLLSDRLPGMLLWSIAVGAVSAVAGCLLARQLNTNAAGMMAVCAGGQFALAVFLAPRHGIIAKALRTMALTVRIICEDLIAILYRFEEQAGPRSSEGTAASECFNLAGPGWLPRLCMPLLKRRGLVVEVSPATVRLTPAGRHLARSLVRSHRLWEAYLSEHFELPADHLHEPASRVEHFIGPELQERLARELARPETDPHGQSIPSAPETKSQ